MKKSIITILSFLCFTTAFASTRLDDKSSAKALDCLISRSADVILVGDVNQNTNLKELVASILQEEEGKRVVYGCWFQKPQEMKKVPVRCNLDADSRLFQIDVEFYLKVFWNGKDLEILDLNKKEVRVTRSAS